MRFIVTEKGQIMRLQMKEEQRQRERKQRINVLAPEQKYDRFLRTLE